MCLRDTFIPEGRKLRDPRRLYAPGRMYHIVERKFCRCGRFPPEVRTAIPVDGRFEHIVLSCNATSDHAIIWIEREAEKALENLKESGTDTTMTKAPVIPRFERLQTIEKEHKDALERAVSLKIPHAAASTDAEGESSGEKIVETCEDEVDEDSSTKNKELKACNARANWNDLVQRLLKKDESGQALLKTDADVCE